jgi:hypothetical protein
MFSHLWQVWPVPSSFHGSSLMRHLTELKQTTWNLNKAQNITATRLCSPFSATDTERATSDSYSESPRFEPWPSFSDWKFRSLVQSLKKYAGIEYHIRPLPLPPTGDQLEENVRNSEKQFFSGSGILGEDNREWTRDSAVRRQHLTAWTMSLLGFSERTFYQETCD